MQAEQRFCCVWSADRSVKCTDLQHGSPPDAFMTNGLEFRELTFLRENILHVIKVQGFFIRHIIYYTGYNQKWNVNQIRSAQWTVQKNKNNMKVTQHKSIYMGKKREIKRKMCNRIKSAKTVYSVSIKQRSLFLFNYFIYLSILLSYLSVVLSVYCYVYQSSPLRFIFRHSHEHLLIFAE